MRYLGTFLLFLWSVLQVHSHEEFTPEGCLAIHNALRARHEDTNDVVYDLQLEKTAQESARFLSYSDSSEVYVDPTRPLPKKRKRRHVHDDVDERLHIESWDGDIFYPASSVPKANGESIHKMCCTTEPHCPKEFFRGLLFPPSAESVVNDFYQQEIDSYDFSSGKKKTQYFTQIKHFTDIVWKKTTKIGCAQTKMTAKKCVYTIIHYQVKGSEGTPDDFKQNVGALIVESSSSKVLMIFLIVFFIVLLISLIVLCLCCRERIREKYYEIKIKTDTMKAEQELETDSTAFWWLKIFKRRRRSTRRRQSTSRSSKHHRSLRDKNVSIEVVHTSRPQRSFKQPMRTRGESNAQSFAIKYQGISKKPQAYRPDETIYENTRNLNIKPNQVEDAEEVYENSGYYNKQEPEAINDHKTVTREPSFSGKPAPPPVPIVQARPNVRPNAPMMPPIKLKQQDSKPKVAVRPVESQKPVASVKPVMKPSARPPGPPSAAPRPSQRPTQSNELDEQETPSAGVNELRSKFDQGGAKKSPPVKTKPKPMMPPTQRR